MSMWSNNLLKARVSDVKNSDTLSEVSESGTGTSGVTSNWDCNEELKDFVAKIGLKDVADLYQDRFRVDRKKLEQMLSGDNDALLPADVFFAKIMEDTDTYITWPNKLKLGAKSKKDPHVRVAGKPENVDVAKERIMTMLDTKYKRSVTMKMDVSYTDHSHIIGKGGHTIKRVMEETHCHVHFPDSNRSNPMEKSNQVSISGDIEGVEGARSRVRSLVPLIFGFELPIMSQSVDTASPYITKVQEQFKVQVIFKTRPKLHASLVLVKGAEWEVEQVKRATTLLMRNLCGNLATKMPVRMSMEIPPHHHQTVLGKNHANLKAIMQHTSCQIMVPDASDPHIPILKKSNVNISGKINNVYKARQLLMGSLPLILIFDLPEDSSTIKTKPNEISDIQYACNININFRQKVKQNTKVCIIKGIERQAANIHKARNMILGADEPAVCADIPETYHLPDSAPSSPFPISDLLPTPTNNPSPNPLSPLLKPLILSPWQCPVSSTAHTPPPFFFPSQTQPPSNLSAMQSLGSSGYHSANQFSLDPSSRAINTSFSSNGSAVSSPLNSPIPNPSNTTFRNYSETSSSDLSSVLSEMNFPSGYHGPTLESEQCYVSPNEYESKRLAGLRAMQTRPTPETYRVPTGTWSGYGISHTSPAAWLKSPNQEDDIWKSSTSKASEMMLNFPDGGGACASPSSLNKSNILDQTSSHVMSRMSGNWTDLPALLIAIGLERYINVFNSHEIDLGTFATFTDHDFIQIGINAYGARRRLQLAVLELNKQMKPFSMAPGAERKGSSSSFTSAKDW